MPFDTNYRDGWIYIRASGEISPQDEIEAMRRLAGSPEFEDGVSIVLDNRMRDPAATADHVRLVAREFSQILTTSKISRLAIVAVRPVTIGLARMFEALVDDQPVQVRTFQELEAAEAWIKPE